MSRSTVRLRRGRVLWRQVTGGVLIRRPGTDSPVRLTGSGEAMWRELGEPISRDVLVERLVAAHLGDPLAVAEDVDRTLAELVGRGLVDEC